MTLDLRAIRAFVDNVDLVLADDDLRRSGGEVDTYLDTADVRGAALGMHAFYGVDNTFQAPLFDHPRALVQALAASGHLGTFQLLPSHQAEFLSLLSVDFGLPQHRGIEDLASQFWHDAGILQSSGGNPRSLGSLSAAEIKELVQHQVGNADRFFKAVESIRGTWQSRVRDWRKKNILEIARDRQDISELAGMQLFKQLKAELDNRRAERPVNNFADAIALVSLIRKVDAFRSRQTEHFPCFYAATSLFEQVVNAPNVRCADRLEAPLPGGRTARVLRSTDYFILRTVFAISNTLPPEAQRKILLSVDDLRKIHSQMREILEAHEKLTAQQVRDVGLSGETLKLLVESIREWSFFEHIWLPYRGEKDTRQAVRRLRAAAVVLDRDKKMEGTLAKVVDELRQGLQANADSFKRLRAFWEQLPAWYREHSSALSRHADHEESIFRWTGLFRFSLPQPIRGRIVASIAALVSSDDEVEVAAVRSVIKAYWNAMERPGPAALADAEHACAVLWVASMDFYILQLLERFDRRHFSLDLIYAAAAVRLGRDVEKTLPIYRKLEELREKEKPTSRTRADIASGLAYLYYHLWNRAQKSHSVRSQVKSTLRLQESRLIKRAVERATEAYDLLQKSDDDSKRVYTLNQMVYCMTLARSPLTRLTPVAETLRTFSEHEDSWSYRYDETLAQYYLYLSETVSNLDVIEKYLQLAYDRAAKALKAAPEDPEIIATEEKIREKLVTAQAHRIGTGRISAAPLTTN